MLSVILYRTSRLPHLPRTTARFWASLTVALVVYAVGMVGNLAALMVQAMSGHPVPPLGSDLIYPLAGLVTMYAMFQYPTTAGTRGEKITVALDVGIVLLGAASFIWYFSVSPQWAPELGWLRLSETLGPPVMLLVAGFGILRVAFVGVGVLSRPRPPSSPRRGAVVRLRRLRTAPRRVEPGPPEQGDALPDLDGQGHDGDPAVLAPVLTAFFAG